jgi:ankyrin repeat protein
VDQDAIIRAVESADAAQTAALLRANPALARTPVHHRDPRGETLLHLVVPDLGQPTTPAHLAVAGLLLDGGAEIDATGFPANNEGATPLIYAAWADQVPLVELLLARGANREARSHRGERAMDQAARHGNRGVVEALIAAGDSFTFSHLLQAGLTERAARLLDADPALLTRRDPDGSLPLHQVVGPENRYDPDLLRLLIARGADIAARDGRGRTALHCALDAERPQAVTLLLAYGAGVDIFAAAGLGQTEQVEAMLRDDPALAQTPQDDGITPLFYAARAGHLRIAGLLQEHGARAEVSVARWWMEPTPLHAAALHGHTEMCRLLLDAGSLIEGRNEHGYTPLLVAARWQHLELVTLFLERGADLHAHDDNGVSALDWAAGAGNLALVRLLVAHGFDVNRKAPRGSWSERTALHFAAAHGRADVIRFLLASGADPTLTDRMGRTPEETLPETEQESLTALFRPYAARDGSGTATAEP